MADWLSSARQGLGNLVDIGSTIFGLPETGLSERIAGGPTLNTGQAYAQTTNPSIVSPVPTAQTMIQAGGTYNPGGADYPIAGGYQAPTGGGDTYLNQLSKMDRNPVQETEYQRMLAEQQNSAQNAYNAQNQQLNTQFDYAKAQLEGQLPGLANQRDQSLGQLDLGLQDVRNQVGTSKTNLQTNTQQQINQAGSTARNVQGQNRNVLRSLGILISSVAGQILAKPGNQFDEQRAQLGQFLVQKTTELDQYVNQKVSEASQLKNSIVQNYQDLVNKIQTDLRFNERQRNDALQSANAALTQHLSDISMSVMNYKQQADLQKQQIQASLGSVLGYTAPTANLNASGYQTLSNQGQNTATPQMTPEELQRRKQLGLM